MHRARLRGGTSRRGGARAGRAAQACHRPARQLGHGGSGTRCESRHLQEVRPGPRPAVHQRRGRDAAGGVVARGGYRRRRGHARRARGVRERRAGAHHRWRGDRCGGLLVRAGGQPDQDGAGHRRPQHRLFHQRLVDQRHRARAVRAVSHPGQADRHRRAAGDLHAGDVGASRCRLGVPAVRRRRDRPEAHPLPVPRQRPADHPRPDHARHHDARGRYWRSTRTASTSS